MKVTKYEHACFTVEIDGKILIVDPGGFTKSLVIPDNVVAIVVTHAHPDHFDPDMLAGIYDKNHDSVLIALPEIVEKMPDHKSQAVNAGDKVNIGPFDLEFFGGKHAVIHESMDTADNIGVFINDTIYYPGDSFVEPNRPVELLALPTSGPWLKLSEVIDFIQDVKPKKFFPTHDFHNSEAGRGLVAHMTEPYAREVSSEPVALGIGESLEI